jgi:hypothetical protein
MARKKTEKEHDKNEFVESGIDEMEQQDISGADFHSFFVLPHYFFGIGNFAGGSDNSTLEPSIN